MKRKNVNLKNPCLNEDGSIDYVNSGVDLNWNYGFKFALDDEGSSNDSCADDYRGTEAFSELET